MFPFSGQNVTSNLVPVCQEDYAYLAEVPEGGSVSLRLWYNHPQAFHQSTCNVWCYNMHEKPRPKYKESTQQKLFVDVVSNLRLENGKLSFMVSSLNFSNVGEIDYIE